MTAGREQPRHSGVWSARQAGGGLGVSGGCLECGRDAEQMPVGAAAADQLQPDRQSVRTRRTSPGSASWGGGASRATVARESGPDWTASSSAASATVRAIGPATPRVSAGSVTGHRGTRPGDGRKPTTLQKLAGLRNDPPRSLPSARQTIRAASAAAAPPLLPPALRLRS